MDELFEIKECLSPRLAWLKHFGLRMETRKEIHYCIFDNENFGTGENEEEACVDLCIKTKLPHWNEP